ncbi:MAG: selenide, water dikinase SelD [Candidatus Sumerlaeia bacterium]|nr:selenide, water dikinase SelD [Candidatus Sumerlaeia bacterium]
MVDIQRRKSVMSRSIKLGHCVCNPKKPCPCDEFRQYNVCACAGERLPVKSGEVRLTQYVRSAGCASKIGQADLLRILEALPPVSDPNVVVGAAAGDDAGIYRLDEKYNLVQTVDVFTPVVDDAYLFGQIAAANSVSDIYAMGGRPLTALSIVGFPIEQLDGRILEAMLRGGMDKLQEAGCTLIGGHSINDEEIKLGFAVTGVMDAAAPVRRNNARPGDALVLTKPLGTGMLSFGAQIGHIPEPVLHEAGGFMAALNKDAAELMLQYGAHACTDITGFGLAGHLVEMIRGSGVSAEIHLETLPVFAAVPLCIQHEILSGAIERNQEYAMAWVEAGGAAAEALLPILYDPQTSGGLLVALPEDSARQYVAAMHDRGHAAAAIIGRVTEKPLHAAEGRVVVIGRQLQNTFGRSEVIPMASKPSVAQEGSPEAPTCCASAPSRPPAEETACCAAAPAAAGAAPPAPGAIVPDAYMNFMALANQEGLIDKRAKKLMAVALSVAMRCKPCQIIHIKGALQMGITKAELDEAATLGVSFAGCPALMMYKDVCAELNL